MARKENCREVDGRERERKVKSRDGKPFPSLFALSVCLFWGVFRGPEEALSSEPFMSNLFFTVLVLAIGFFFFFG